MRFFNILSALVSLALISGCAAENELKPEDAETTKLTPRQTPTQSNASRQAEEFLPPNLSTGYIADVLECVHGDVALRGQAGYFLSEWNIDRIPTAGEINVSFLFVNFLDSTGDGKPLERAPGFFDNMARLYENSSYGAVSFNLKVFEDYIDIPKKATAYGMQRWGAGDPGGIVTDAIRYSDSRFDFSGTDVLFVIPPQSAQIVYGPNIRYPTGEGWRTADGVTIDNANVGEGMGLVDPREERRPDWWWAAHELSHSFGLAHPYVQGSGAIWDISQGWGRATPELLGWSRLTLGWIKQNQLTCLADLEEGLPFNGFVENIHLPSNRNKLIMIRTETDRTLVVEARNSGGLDKVPGGYEGVLVYEVNLESTELNGEFVNLVSKERYQDNLFVGTVGVGSSVEYKDYFVRILGEADDGYYVEITKLSNIAPEGATTSQ